MNERKIEVLSNYVHVLEIKQAKMQKTIDRLTYETQ